MTPVAFRKLAMSMPNATEYPHFERLAFKARTIFATIAIDGSNAMIQVRPVELAFALIQKYPEQFFSFGGWTEKFGSLGVYLKGADPKLIKQLMIEAAQRAQPKTKAAPRRRAKSPTASTRRRR